MLLLLIVLVCALPCPPVRLVPHATHKLLLGCQCATEAFDIHNATPTYQSNSVTMPYLPINRTLCSGTPAGSNPDSGTSQPVQPVDLPPHVADPGTGPRSFWSFPESGDDGPVSFDRAGPTFSPPESGNDFPLEAVVGGAIAAMLVTVAAVMGAIIYNRKRKCKLAAKSAAAAQLPEIKGDTGPQQAQPPPAPNMWQSVRHTLTHSLPSRISFAWHFAEASCTVQALLSFIEG